MRKRTTNLGVWPRLTRFYGLTPTEIATMPGAVYDLYVRQLPALAAEEQSLVLQAADFPNMDKDDRRDVIRALTRAIEGHAFESEPEASNEIDAGKLSGMGINVVHEAGE